LTYFTLTFPIFKWLNPKWLESTTGLLFRTSASSPLFPSQLGANTSNKEVTHRIHLARHDHHNLELKSFVDPGKVGFQGWLELHLFVPASFQLSRWEKKELRNDLHCRTRLAISVCPEQGHAALREAMRRLTCSVSELPFETLVEDSKDAGAAIHETFRRWTSAHKKQCRIAHSLMHRESDAANHLFRLCHEVQRSAESIQMVRGTVRALEPNRFPVLALLDEYICNLYLKYLSDLETELSKCPVQRFQSAEYHRAQEQIAQMLATLRHAEASRMHSKGVPIPPPTDEQRESYLVRLSQLKKFFQSKMFVDVARQPSDKRIAETTAFVGTALAGLSAASFQYLYYPSSDELAVSGVFLLGLGVFVYTVRDRIKDWLKSTLAKKASSWIADSEETLWIDGQKIGLNKEWCRVTDKRKLPREVTDLRSYACSTEMERDLPEEVFSWKRWQSIPEPLGNRGNESALQENVRINLERYLKFMDDPFKELAVLDTNGQFTRFRSRRVYHFYLAVRSTFQKGPNRPSSHSGQGWPQLHQSEKIFRIVLNKKGIDRIESVDENTAPRKPEWYHSSHAYHRPPV
jgi:hypothetical protein